MNFISQFFASKTNLVRRVESLQHTVDLLTAGLTDISATSSTGNPYKDPQTAVIKLAEKYENKADWGCHQVGNIVDVRAAFIMGNGIKIVKRDAKTGKDKGIKKNGAVREYEFIEEFLQHNDIDEEGHQDFAKEAELEGRFLGVLIPDEETKQIKFRYISYSQYKYEVIADENDYKKYVKVKFKDPKTNKDFEYEEGEFVYKRFAGRTNKVNEAVPKTAKVLRQIEDLDKALNDLRKINHLFASPTPHFKVTNKKEAEALYDKLKGVNWKIGKFLVTAAEFSMVGSDSAGSDSIVKEITMLVKMISGATGIPVHFLGLPDLMSNRAVSTDMFEMIVASTHKERRTWVGFYEELFTKTLKMANDEFNKSFGEKRIGAQILQITEKKLKELVEIWLPLFESNVIDLNYFLEMIPDADPDEIKKSQTEAAVKIVEQLKKQEQDEGGDEDE